MLTLAAVGLLVVAVLVWPRTSGVGDPRVAGAGAGSGHVSTALAPATPREKRVPPRPGAPDRLVIPALHVDAPVVPVALRGSVLVPPSDPTTLGWWAGGALPGAARGSALIAGHTVHTGGGALDHLGELRVGAPVTVRTGGRALHYRVDAVRSLSKTALARRAAQLFSQGAPGRLVLLTCTGWDGTAYRGNTVVTAQLR